MSKFLDDYKTKINKEFMSHVSQKIKERFETDKEIDLEEFKEMRINSYEYKLIEPLLSPEAFIFRIDEAIKNISVRQHSMEISSTYDEYILTDGINELLKRYKKLVRK